MLKQIEIGSPRVVKGHDFTINDSILGKIAKGVYDVRILLAERFPVFSEKT